MERADATSELAAGILQRERQLCAAVYTCSHSQWCGVGSSWACRVAGHVAHYQVLSKHVRNLRARQVPAIEQKQPCCCRLRELRALTGPAASKEGIEKV